MADGIMSSEELSTRQINRGIKSEIASSKNDLSIEVREKRDSIAVGLGDGVNVTLKGNLGDFIGALNNGAKIKIEGNTGRYVGNNMTGGEIIVKGSAKDGVGFGTYEGTIVIHGDAGDGIGQLNKGGIIVVDGNIGNLAGLYMLSGNIIVTGNAGIDTGDWMIGGTIYVGGDYKAGTNAEIRQMDAEDKQKLKEIFDAYKIEADIQKFTKIQPKKLRPFYG
ncbi:tributyrin esterase [Methanobacterium sp. ACI-7]|uniref:GltB/FmdC/FwdC-like GXGXG domain-containing protein n=1 Tax=unclassified Methanobacterium TaxID=2627676 RepID=UPI0039C096D0